MVPVREGDYISCDTGASGAHQLINTGSTVLRYLCIDATQYPDVTVYPDKQHYGIMSQSSNIDEFLCGWFRVDDAKGYYDRCDQAHFTSGAATRKIVSQESPLIIGGLKSIPGAQHAPVVSTPATVPVVSTPTTSTTPQL
eukprot:CAMPEP_0197866184 /NCGR_PEP_ID=MMETSP1438-20131217/44078_1 /TAXON_ID=1461541 /ORGANISM="Pterosperma sp., Strain CCMP1384" /LENGTH=139 /DNA_ID=CAMNT_0043484731 /DNA_START=1395 /DNA_END=1814 /DNA_ORIENTATION=-